MAGPIVSPSWEAAEVETDVEEEEAELGRMEKRHEGGAPEVDEDISTEDVGDRPTSTPGASSNCGSADYIMPERNKEVWKQFGCDNKAGRLLRQLYTTKSDRASKVSYPRLPSPSQRWTPPPLEKKACPQKAPVKVPRPVRRPTVDRDDPRNWRMPVPCRKPAAEILAEMEAARPEVPDLVPGRDRIAEKEGLQERFQFCGGRAMPKGVMGHVEASDLPPVQPRRPANERDEETGMTEEQRQMFEEMTRGVQRMQLRLRQIEAEEAAEVDPKPSRARTERNKEALRLRNDINRDLQDIDKLLEITEQ